MLEGDLAPVECTLEGDGCELINQCVTHEIWKEIKDKVEEIVEAKTLKDLQERAEELYRKNKNGSYMYHI